jgi:hypothetical protein
MNYSLVSSMSLFLVIHSFAMDHAGLQVLAAWTKVRVAHHTTYLGLSHDNRKIEIDECAKLRKTRNANPYELHYSGKIGKKRLTQAQARGLIGKLHEAKQFTYVHPAVLRPVKKEHN